MAHNITIFFETILFIYSSYLVGRALLDRFHVAEDSRLRNLAWAVLLGYGAFGFIGVLLGIFGMLATLPLRIVLGAAILLSMRRIQHHAKIFFAPSRWHLREKSAAFFAESGWLKVIILVWLIANCFIVFVPITGHDTLDYHLPIINTFRDTGSIFISGDTYGNAVSFPLLAEIFYSVPLIMFGNTSAPFIFQLLQYSALILFLMLIADFARERVKHRFLAPVAALLVLAVMDFLREVMHGGYIDVFVYLFGIASFLAIVREFDSKDVRRSSLWISAIFLGLALAMKYHALLFAAADGAAFVLFALRRSLRRATVIREALVFLGIAAVIAGFWYVKNAVAFGNPVYPMFSDPAFGKEVNWFVLDRTFLNLLLFPFYIFGQWFVSDRESSSRLIPFFYFITLFLSLVNLAVRRKRPTLVEGTLAGFILFYLAALFFLSHQIRFLLPAVIMTPLVLVLFADRFLGWLGEKRERLMARILYGASIAAFVVILLGNFHYFEIKFFYILGRYTEAEYILEIGGQ